MSSQRGFFRRSTSLNWIFSGYRKKWSALIRKYDFRKALFAWDFLLGSLVLQCRGLNERELYRENISTKIDELTDMTNDNIGSVKA
jgi:hypothetical protein